MNPWMAFNEDKHTPQVPHTHTHKQTNKYLKKEEQKKERKKERNHERAVASQ
jgi:hypothetical protein